jgi:hypothetical protein
MSPMGLMGTATLMQHEQHSLCSMDIANKMASSVGSTEAAWRCQRRRLRPAVPAGAGAVVHRHVGGGAADPDVVVPSCRGEGRTSVYSRAYSSPYNPPFKYEQRGGETEKVVWAERPWYRGPPSPAAPSPAAPSPSSPSRAAGVLFPKKVHLLERRHHFVGGCISR